ncbi:c-type cytochrome [Methylocystis parvus]|uniref:c-type cytochrome n=1 Tax=Methylocystis parvus TaxID=134 RepID=UPI003C776158
MKKHYLATLPLLAAAAGIALVTQSVGRSVRHAPQPRQPRAETPAPAQPTQQQQTPQPAPAQETSATPPQPPGPSPYAGPVKVMGAPVSTLFPGNTGPEQPMRNPVANDPEAVQRGMAYFNMFNCVGCHAPNAGGGMGPALSNKFFIYGGEPQNIYLSIYQGRPNGMPSWGAMLPENIIWDLVAYVESISRDPSTTWGQTMSHDAFKIEQTPAEFSKSATPWNQTERFGFGQKPNEKR